MLDRRMSKLSKVGSYGNVTKSLLATLTGEQVDALSKEIGPRGFTSLEASQLKESRDRYQRANNINFPPILNT